MLQEQEVAIVTLGEMIWIYVGGSGTMVVLKHSLWARKSPTIGGCTI